MCNLIVTNITDTNLVKKYNIAGKKRGPDNENIIIVENILFLHNLLSITGDSIIQPYIKDSVAIIFNGEIYNYKNKGIETELDFIYYLYKNCNCNYNDGKEECGGIYNMKQLEGEFAIIIVDFAINKIYLIHDIFATKPFYIGIECGKFCISSYPSVSWKLGITNINKIPPNCCIELDIKTLKYDLIFEMYKWDLVQYKTDFNDFNIALENAIRKRVDTDKEILVNMSSGYDTGTICCILNKLGIKRYNTITIKGIENVDIINERIAKNKSMISQIDYVIELKINESDYYKKMLLQAENITFITYNRFTKEYDFPLDVHNDYAALGLMKIYDTIRKNEMNEKNENTKNTENTENSYINVKTDRLSIKNPIKILISGSGADEIMSDYTINGNSISKNTCFMGKFPEELSSIFPINIMDKKCIWKNFYYGTQEVYLFKEESTTGTYGIEGRYPFLDKYVVQEFIWLTSALKNSQYKAPLANYMKINNYPFMEEKKGFYPFS